MPDEMLQLRTPHSHLSADGLHEQQQAIDAKENAFQQEFEQARHTYGKVLVFVRENGKRVIQQPQNCDQEYARS